MPCGGVSREAPPWPISPWYGRLTTDCSFAASDGRKNPRGGYHMLSYAADAQAKTVCENAGDDGAKAEGTFGGVRGWYG